jgi:hypothetical protein
MFWLLLSGNRENLLQESGITQKQIAGDRQWVEILAARDVTKTDDDASMGCGNAIGYHGAI